MRGEVEFKNVWLSYRPGEPVLKGHFLSRPARRKSRSGRRHRRRQDLDYFGALPFLRCRARRDPGRRHRCPRVGQARAAPPLGFGLAGCVSFFRRYRDQHHAWRSRGSAKRRMVEAARRAQIAPFIERLPNGFHEEVQERGATLSQGQRQLLSFARALAFDPKILDSRRGDQFGRHADRDVDSRGAGRVAQKSHRADHRASACRRSNMRDRILVIHKGEIWEQGSHEELLAQGGFTRGCTTCSTGGRSGWSSRFNVQRSRLIGRFRWLNVQPPPLVPISHRQSVVPVTLRCPRELGRAEAGETLC